MLACWYSLRMMDDMLQDEFEEDESDQVLDQVLDEIGLDLSSSVRMRPNIVCFALGVLQLL